MRIEENYIFSGREVCLHDAINMQIRSMLDKLTERLMQTDPRKYCSKPNVYWVAGFKLFDHMRASNIVKNDYLRAIYLIDGKEVLFKSEINPWKLSLICEAADIESARNYVRDCVTQRDIFMDGIFNSTKIPSIKKVIFNGPATIVIWKDNSKTVVKCHEGDTFDPEKGLAMAICKKVLGTNESKSNFNDIFKKWLPKEATQEYIRVIIPGKDGSLPDDDNK